MRETISTMGLLCRVIVISAVSLGIPSVSTAQIVIPGTGQKIAGDDFEDEDWEFIHNFPKSSREQDGQVRFPLGVSRNELWLESAKRGQPDIIERVATPPGGLRGSKGALLMKTLYSGIPNRPSLKSQQDDLLIDMSGMAGGAISTRWSPNVVVRVYLPPFDEWENATDTSFGFRADVVGTGWKESKGGFLFIKRRKRKTENYWPGMFIQFNSKTDPRYDEDSAVFIIRGDDSGHDFVGPMITQTGWWTLGMSFTPDGRVHYFASPGVDPLTMKDHIASHAPYYCKCQWFHTVFFNICNQNKGRHYSTEWIIDDPELYIIR